VTILALAIGVLLGAAAAFGPAELLARSLGRAQVAAAEAERDLLRERVTDLEASTDHDRELAATLSPLAGALQRVEAQVRTIERDRLEQFARLDEQVTALRSDSAALRSQTASLAGALRSPTARGAWGEVQLRRVVELAGMLPRVDFSTQATARTPEGVTVRPDLVVHLPGGKHVVVDAKAPLAAFLEASEQPGASSRRSAALAHARALRGHVDTLAAKLYWTAFDPTPQLVVCFVPGEAFLAAACDADPTLLEHAMGKRVVLATPTTLLALLRTVALTWQTETLSGNAKTILQLGRELHARLGTLGEHTGQLGRSLQRAVDDYNAVVGTLERRVLVSARRLRDLGVADSDLPEIGLIQGVPRNVSAAELVEETQDEALPPPLRDASGE
jgi:DNA recombination protein RmuC